MTLGPFPGVVSTDLVRRYATATGDPSARVQRGEAVPVAALVTQVWEAQEEGRRSCVDQQISSTATGGVHGEHDIVLHRPLLPDEPLSTWVRAHSTRPAGRNALVTLHYETRAADGELVAEQWWTTAYLGATCPTVGPGAPDHRFPEPARDDPRGAYRVTTGPDLPRGYAEVSGDWSPHHFEPAAARASGFERPFLHGLCTLALCAQGVVAELAGGDPAAVRRLAVRFASPVFVGEDVEVRFYASAPGTYAFEAHSAGRPAITHGLAELRSDGSGQPP